MGKKIVNESELVYMTEEQALMCTWGRDNIYGKDCVEFLMAST
jgi:hypothetical protein